MPGLFSDARFALRALRRQPWSSAAIALTLALGIGATTATYAIFNQLLFRPAPGVDDPAGLVTVRLQAADRTRRFSGFSHAQLKEMRQADTGLSGLTSEWRGNGWVSAAAAAEPEAIDLKGVSRGFFRVMGLQMRLGRPLDDDDVETPGRAVAVISEVLWRKQFAASSDVVGRAIYVNTEPFTIVGVVAAYRGWSIVFKDDLWIPAAEWHVIDRRTGADPFADGHFALIGRLAPGRALDDVERRLTSVFQRVDNAVARKAPVAPAVTRGLAELSQASLVSRLLDLFTILASGSCLLLILACANAANLAVVRATSRQREMAVRLALGAGRWRLVRQQFLESAAIAGAAWTLGLIVATVLCGVFRGTRLLPFLPAIDAVGLDWRVLSVAGLLATATTVAFGVAPAWSAASVDPRRVLQDGRTITRVRHRSRAALVALQFALSLALVVSAGVLFRSLENLRTQDLGFDPAHIVEIGINPSERGYDGVRRDQLVRDVIARFRETPGFDHVAYASPAPISTSFSERQVKARDLPGAIDITVTDAVVSSQYFETMGIALLRGRDFLESEFLRPIGGADQAVVISASLARRLFGDDEGIGRRLDIGGATPATVEVVGVVRDVKSGDLRADPRLMMYRSFGQTSGQTFVYGTLLVRSALPPEEALARGRQALQALAPGLPAYDSGTMSSDIEFQFAEARALSRVMGVVAAIAAVLALGGLYAVVAYLVTERTRELGIRVALGASRRAIVSLVIGRVAWMCAAGAAAGVGLIAASTRLLASRLFRVSPIDPLTIALTLAVLAAAALAAAWMPARRATRIDPTHALRQEG